MARLKAALIREYEDNDEVHIEVHNPRNTEAVTLNFRGEKLAKVSLQLSINLIINDSNHKHFFCQVKWFIRSILTTTKIVFHLI